MDVERWAAQPGLAERSFAIVLVIVGQSHNRELGCPSYAAKLDFGHSPL
jgi:hypothetical protein